MPSSPGHGGIQRRLLALAGLVVIVGGAVGVLFAAGLLGSQGGGAGIEPVAVRQTPPAAGRDGLDVGAEPGKLAPDFEMSAFDGSRQRLSDLRGKAVYVNFWATWCAPCRAELPDIYELQGRHPDDLAVIAVNRAEPKGRASHFLAKLPRNDGRAGVSFAVNGLDPSDTLYNEYHGLGMPVSVFIDRDGVVTAVRDGRLSLAQMEQFTAEALAGAGSAGTQGS